MKADFSATVYSGRLQKKCSGQTIAKEFYMAKVSFQSEGVNKYVDKHGIWFIKNAFGWDNPTDSG